MTIKYLLTIVTPNDYKMDISNSIHDSYDETSRELEKLCYSIGEIDAILAGDTYEDGEGWIKVTKVSV